MTFNTTFNYIKLCIVNNDGTPYGKHWVSVADCSRSKLVDLIMSVNIVQYKNHATKTNNRDLKVDLLLLYVRLTEGTLERMPGIRWNKDTHI